MLIFLGLVIVFLLSCGLATFHTYLVMTAQTTFECMRRSQIDYLQPFPADVHPFSQGARWKQKYFKMIRKMIRRFPQISFDHKRKHRSRSQHREVPAQATASWGRTAEVRNVGLPMDTDADSRQQVDDDWSHLAFRCSSVIWFPCTIGFDSFTSVQDCGGLTRNDWEVSWRLYAWSGNVAPCYVHNRLLRFVPKKWKLFCVYQVSYVYV